MRPAQAENKMAELLGTLGGLVNQISKVLAWALGLVIKPLIKMPVSLLLCWLQFLTPASCSCMPGKASVVAQVIGSHV